MKTKKLVLAATALVAGLLLTSQAPAFAQGAVGQGEVLEAGDTQDGNDSSNDSNGIDDKAGLWGLLGLIGLAGLAGLKRRDRHREVHVARTHTTDVPRV